MHLPRWSEVISKADTLGNWIVYLQTPLFDKNAPLDNYWIHITDGISILHLYCKSNKTMPKSKYGGCISINLTKWIKQYNVKIDKI